MKNILFFLLFFFSHLYSEDYQLSICAIFQNEAIYLEEWIVHHLNVGVEHFWLYNNNSTDHYKERLDYWIDQGVVELIEWPSYQNQNDFYHFSFEVQTSAYNDALNRAKGVTKWLAIIDVDEFLVPVKDDKITDVLEKYYSNVSGLCVNWQCYGTSHIWKTPEGKMLENLTYKMRWDYSRNMYYKSIVQPLYVSYTSNPHYCFYLPGHFQVNTIYQPIGEANTGVYIDKIRINHYWSRDEWFLYNVKIPRYQRWGVKSQDVLDLVECMNEEYDPMSNYVNSIVKDP